MITKILIRVPEHLKKCLQASAIKRGSTLNQFILQILWEWAEKNNNSIV